MRMKYFIVAVLITIIFSGLARANSLTIPNQITPSVTDDTGKAAFAWLDFESGYAKAIKENKILLVDVYTDWCGWCKVMDRNTYSNDTIVELINASFVAVKLNPEKNRTYVFGDQTMTAAQVHSWLGYGRTFGYPTTYFLSEKGSNPERHALVGYVDAAEFTKVLQEELNKLGD